MTFEAEVAILELVRVGFSAGDVVTGGEHVFEVTPEHIASCKNPFAQPSESYRVLSGITSEQRYERRIREGCIQETRPGEWRIEIPVGDWNYSVDITITEEGIRFEYVTIPWSVIDERRKG